MAVNLKGRSFLTLLDFSSREIEYLLDLARDIKRAHYTGNEIKTLAGKSVCLLFQKDSTRTRAAFQAGAQQQGAYVTYIGSSGSQMGKKESIKDTARVLGRIYDGIEFRGFKQSDVEILAKYSGVPVWNGLTDKYHPTQILADFLTVQEQFGTLKGKKLVFFGDARNNMGNSLMIGAAKMGMHFVSCAPKELWPDKSLIETCQQLAAETGAKIELTADPLAAVKDADVLYTDVWVSMGEPKEVWAKRIKQLSPYQVNMKLIKAAAKDVIFMHCLPAFHNLETEVGHQIYEQFKLKELEVTDEVFESKYSKVFEEAENRLHTIKAIMMATL